MTKPNNETALFVQSLALLGGQLYNERTAAEWRLNIQLIDFLVGLNALVHAETSGLTVELLRRDAPEFCLAYEEIMLSGIEEKTPHGYDDETTAGICRETQERHS